MTERCEPPEGLRGVQAPHWICRDQDGARPFVDEWYPAKDGQHGFFDIAGEPPFFGIGYRYIAPVPDPAAVSALVRATRALDYFAWSLVKTPSAHGRTDMDRDDDTPTGMYVFIRAEGWYPVHEPRGDTAIPEHVRLNPGTKEVQCAVTGRVVWKEPVH